MFIFVCARRLLNYFLRFPNVFNLIIAFSETHTMHGIDLGRKENELKLKFMQTILINENAFVNSCI